MASKSFASVEFAFWPLLKLNPDKTEFIKHMGGILAEGSTGSASLPTYSVFTSGWNFFKLGTCI